jgi:hypothetical protein
MDTNIEIHTQIIVVIVIMMLLIIGYQYDTNKTIPNLSKECFQFKIDNIQDKKYLYKPLNFWFCKNKSTAIPLSVVLTMNPNFIEENGIDIETDEPYPIEDN